MTPCDNPIREAHDDLVQLMDCLRSEETIYKDYPPMAREEVLLALDKQVLQRLKQALGVVQGSDTDVFVCT